MKTTSKTEQYIEEKKYSKPKHRAFLYYIAYT